MSAQPLSHEANPLWEPGRPAPAAPPDATCAACALRDPSTGVCARHAPAQVLPAWPACPAFTSSLDCQACAACCAEGYSCVEVDRDEPFARDHHALLVEEFGQLQLPRPDGRCVCLEGSTPDLRCILYDQRPRSCREFPVGGVSCVAARRRVALTP